MRTSLCVLVLFASAIVAPLANGQAVRFDSFSYTTSASCVSGKICPVQAIPGTLVNFCTGTQGTLEACLGSPATTYTNAGAGTPCANTAQLTLPTGGSCISAADSQGNFGGWFLPGVYSYYMRIPATAGGGTFGPYPISLGASAGCPLGSSCDANFATLALACTSAGNGTLYVTRHWNALTTQSLSCPLIMLGDNAVLQPASGQTVTATIQQAPLAPICDISLGGNCSFSSEILYPQWWGAKGDGSHDDLPAFKALVAGVRIRSYIYITDGTYKWATESANSANELLDIAVPVQIGCQSWAALITTDSSLGAGMDVIRQHGPGSGAVLDNCKGLAGTTNTGAYFYDLDATPLFFPVTTISNASPPIVTSSATDVNNASAVTCKITGNTIYDGVYTCRPVAANQVSLYVAGTSMPVAAMGVGTGGTLQSNGTAAIQNFLVSHDWIQGFAGGTIRSTFPSWIADPGGDGVFAGEISGQGLLIGGASSARVVDLNGSGDSVQVKDTQITAGNGVCIYVKQVPGANTDVFSGNNLTCPQGGIKIDQGLNPKIESNNIEPHGTVGTASLIDLDSVENPVVKNNLFSMADGATLYAIHADNTNHLTVKENDFHANDTSQFYFVSTTNTTKTRWDLNTYEGSVTTPAKIPALYWNDLSNDTTLSTWYVDADTGGGLVQTFYPRVTSVQEYFLDTMGVPVLAETHSNLGATFPGVAIQNGTDPVPGNLSMGANGQVTWSASPDVGAARCGAGCIKPTDGSSGVGVFQGPFRSSDGTVGISGTCSSSTTLTVKNGLITGCS